MNKRIANIAPEVFPIPPLKGGAVEYGMYTLSKICTRYTFYMLSVQDSGLPLTNEEGHLHHHRYKISAIDRLLLSTYKLPFKQSTSFLYWFLYAFWCARQCRKYKVQMIHIHNRWQFIPVISFFNPKAKILFHIHQLSALNMSDRQVKILRKKIDIFAGCSEFLSRRMRERFNVDAKHTVVIHPGMCEEDFYPIAPEEKEKLRIKHDCQMKKVILYAGRLAENKGAHVVIEALDQINRDDVLLIIAGGATYSDNSKTDYLRQLEHMPASLKGKVRFVGFIPHDQLVEYFWISDIFAFPSQVEEGLGQSLTEAMLCTLPVVGSDRGGIGEVIQDGVNGYLIQEYDDTHIWKERLERLLNDSSRCREFGVRGRERVQLDFPWPKVSERMTKIYDQHLER